MLDRLGKNENLNGKLDDPETREFVDELEKEYNKLAKDHNDLVDDNNKLKDYINQSEANKSKGTGKPIDNEEYKKLFEEYETYKKVSAEKIDLLKKEVASFKDSNQYENHDLFEKVKDLERDLKEKNSKIELLKDSSSNFEKMRTEHQKELDDLQNQLDEKYDHFEELNKYINDLLREKKTRTANLEEKGRKIAELELELQREKNRLNKDFPSENIPMGPGQTSINYQYQYTRTTKKDIPLHNLKQKNENKEHSNQYGELLLKNEHPINDPDNYFYRHEEEF